MGAIGRGLKFLVFVVVAAVLTGEGYARYVLRIKPGPLPENHVADAIGKFAEFDPVLGVRYRPNVDVLIDSPTGDFSILYKTNEIGLRDRPMGTHLRSELKMLVFGDEFAEGWGNDIDKTPVFVAQNVINEQTKLKPPVRLVITGKSGYGAAQNYLAAPALIDELKPALIVFVYSSLMPHADALFLRDAALKDGLATGLRPDAPQTPRLAHLEDYAPAVHGLLADLAPQSSLARWLADFSAQRAFDAAITPGDPLTDHLAGMRAAQDALAAVHAPTLAHVQALARLAAGRHIPFMVVHVPLPPQVSNEQWSVGRGRFGVSSGTQSGADAAVVQNFCTESKLRCVDLHDSWQKYAAEPSNAPIFYRSELALTAEGAQMFGQWMGDEIYRWMGELRLR